MSNEARIADFNKFGGIKLYKAHGFSGDIIEMDNGIRTRTLCSLEDFKRGRFHIYEEESGREITDGEIPWR